MLATIAPNIASVRWPYRKVAKAANRGLPEAQSDLGAMYSLGLGVEKDYQKAAQWLRRAADRGYATAQFNLGLAYIQGQGVPKDLAIAYMWLNLAAAGGDEDAGKRRDLLEKVMTPGQIEDGQRLAREWSGRQRTKWPFPTTAP